MTLEEQAIAEEFDKLVAAPVEPPKDVTPTEPVNNESNPDEKVESPVIEDEPSPVNQEAPVIEEKFDERKPWFETDSTLSSEHRKKVKSLGGMFASEKTKREAAEKRAAELEARINELSKPKEPLEPIESPAKEDDDIDSLIDKARTAYEDALVDGEPRDVTGKLYKELRELETKKVKTPDVDLDSRVEQILSSRTEKQAISEVVSKSVKDYPFLDTAGSSPNYRAIAAVKAARDEYIDQGYSPADAIAKAVEEEAPRYSSSTPSIPRTEKVIDENKLREMEAVRGKDSPIITRQSRKSEPQSLEDAWKEL